MKKISAVIFLGIAVSLTTGCATNRISIEDYRPKHFYTNKMPLELILVDKSPYQVLEIYRAGDEPPHNIRANSFENGLKLGNDTGAMAASSFEEFGLWLAGGFAIGLTQKFYYAFLEGDPDPDLHAAKVFNLNFHPNHLAKYENATGLDQDKSGGVRWVLINFKDKTKRHAAGEQIVLQKGKGSHRGVDIYTAIPLLEAKPGDMNSLSHLKELQAAARLQAQEQVTN